MSGVSGITLMVLLTSQLCGIFYLFNNSVIKQFLHQSTILIHVPS